MFVVGHRIGHGTAHLNRGLGVGAVGVSSVGQVRFGTVDSGSSFLGVLGGVVVSNAGQVHFGMVGSDSSFLRVLASARAMLCVVGATCSGNCGGQGLIGGLLTESKS